MGGSIGSLAGLAALLAPQSLAVDWWRRSDGNWCSLLTLDLANFCFIGRDGVYIIWRASDGRVVRVGQGWIADRLRAHRADPEIVAHGPHLLVTWTEVLSLWQDGVERYLADHYQPLVGRAFPSACPIPVNLP